jgi:hypothetical protein
MRPIRSILAHGANPSVLNRHRLGLQPHKVPVQSQVVQSQHSLKWKGDMEHLSPNRDLLTTRCLPKPTSTPSIDWRLPNNSKVIKGNSEGVPDVTMIPFKIKFKDGGVMHRGLSCLGLGLVSSAWTSNFGSWFTGSSECNRRLILARCIRHDEGLEKATRGGWMGVNQNSSRELGLYHKINPTPLSSNSVETA